MSTADTLDINTGVGGEGEGEGEGEGNIVSLPAGEWSNTVGGVVVSISGLSPEAVSLIFASVSAVTTGEKVEKSSKDMRTNDMNFLLRAMAVMGALPDYYS